MIRFLQGTSTARRVLLIVFLGLVIVSMVITLAPADWTGQGQVAQTGVLATVDGEPVTISAVERQARGLAQQQFPRGFPEQFLPFFKQRAAEQLVMQKALLSEAGRMGLQVTDDELRDELRNGPLGQQFYPDGKFIGREQYENFVGSNFRMSVREFEDAVKADMLMRKLRAVIEGGVVVTPAEVEEQFRRENMKVKFDYAVITPQDVLKEIKPTEEELRAYYDKNKSRYKDSIPEKRKIRYAVLDASRLGAEAEPAEADLRRLYEQRKEAFKVQESVDVRHILISAPAGDEKADATARAKAQDLAKQAKSGADFAQLARTHSEDPGSKESGGLYEGVTRGKMVKEFEQAAFSLKPGEVSDPVKTSYGYHVLKVEKRQTEKTRSFDEVKAELLPLARQQRSEQALESAARALLAEAKTRGLQDASKRRNVPMLNSEYVARFEQLPGLGPAQEFMDAAFSGNNKGTPTLARLTNGYAVLEVVDIQPAATPSFDEIRGRVENEVKQEKGAALLEQRARELSDRARAAASLRQAAKGMGVTVKTTELVTASSQVPDLGPLSGAASVVFGMKPGEISAPVALSSSGAAVLALVEKREADMADFDAKRAQIREQLLQQKRGEVMQLYAVNLKERLEKSGKIKYNEEERKRLMGNLGASS